MELQGRFEDVDAELWPANPTSPGTRGSNRHRSTKRRYKAQSNVLPKNDPETRRAKVELKAKVKKIGELPQGFKLACPFWKGSPEDYPKCWAIHRKDMSGLRFVKHPLFAFIPEPLCSLSSKFSTLKDIFTKKVSTLESILGVAIEKHPSQKLEPRRNGRISS